MKKLGLKIVLAGISLAVMAIAVSEAIGVDVSKGQFYTEQEYQKLSKKERQAYCDALAAEAAKQASKLKELQANLSTEKSKIEDLKSRIREVDSQLEPLESQVADLERQIKELESLPTEWTVRNGESLSKISGYQEIYNDPRKWPRIYRANRDKINDPNLIYPGWVLRIPRGLPEYHVVTEGEWLSKIAGYWEIYNDWRQWTKIYEANRDKIKNPDLIMPGWELKIPR